MRVRVRIGETVRKYVFTIINVTWMRSWEGEHDEEEKEEEEVEKEVEDDDILGWIAFPLVRVQTSLKKYDSVFTIKLY